MFIILNNGIFEEQGMSGSDQRALNWSKIFREKYDVRIMTSKEGRKRYLDIGFSKESIISFNSKSASNISVLFFYIKQILSTAKYLKSLPCTIVYSSSDVIADAVPALYKKFISPKTKWIAGCHLIWPNPWQILVNPRFKGFSFVKGFYFFTTQRILFFFFKRKADLILVSNSLDKEFLSKKGISSHKILVTPGALESHGVEQKGLKMSSPGLTGGSISDGDVDSRFRGNDKNEAFGSVPGGFLYDACFIGRNHPQKGIQDVFLIWKKVLEQIPGAKLAFIGDFQKEKIDPQLNIHSLGFLRGEKKYEVLKRSKVLLFPSRHESFGMVALEAMACGLPVVAYDLPELREFYGEEMPRSRVGDVDTFSKIVLDLLNHEEKRLQLGNLAYKKAQLFTWEKTASQILETL